jgi:hypothetical protein
MDETLPTTWPDITPLAVAGNKWRDAARRETGAKAFLRRVMLDRKTWPSDCCNWPSITDHTLHHPHCGHHFSLPLPLHRR